jgi:hypothetical protein
VASGKEAFTDAVRRALDEQRPDLRERRVAFARANDWSARSRSIGALLEDLARPPGVAFVSAGS